MKIDVNYSHLHGAIENLKQGQQLDDYDRELLLQLIVATENDYYPSKLDLEKQKQRVERLNSMTDLESDTAKRLLEQCRIFENEFC